MKNRHILQILLFCVVGLLPAYVSANSVEYVLDDLIFSGSMSGAEISADLDFAYGGNAFGGKLFFSDLKSVTGVTLDLSGVQKNCTKQVRGYYINPARGLRAWPLDQDTLTQLQYTDPSYLYLTITGGLFICDGSSFRIFGAIQHLWKTQLYQMVAGVQYNFLTNSYLPNYDSSLYFYAGTTEGYLFDQYGGIASVVGSGLDVTTVCGDGVSEGIEICDEGITNGQLNHCNVMCNGIVFAVCGNGSIEPTETCDDGSGSNGQIGNCNLICNGTERGYCGDSYVATAIGETCDEGSSVNGQAGHCNATCDGTVAAPAAPSGGGGGGVSLAVCAAVDCTKQINYLCCSSQQQLALEETKIDQMVLSSGFALKNNGTCSVADSPYSTEITEAFSFAYAHNITSQCPITKANINGTLIRKHAAKMISQFALAVLDKKPDSLSVCEFNDMSNETPEMKYYAKLACKLGLMGLKSDGTPDSKFNPGGEVTRAQFGTMLSRLLYGNQYNGKPGAYYTAHLNALKAAGIMTKISNPTMLELRGFVMIMMERIGDANEETEMHN